MKRIVVIKRALTGSYLFSFIFIVLLYLGINILVNQMYVTGPSVLVSFNPLFLIPFLTLHGIVAVLVGLSINLAHIKYTELKAVQAVNKESGITALGIFGGLLGGACPGCFAGLFPAVLGLFGISASLSVLPLYGLEIQAFSAVLLGVSIFLLTKPAVCEI